MAEAPVAVHSCRLEVLADTADWIAVHVPVGLLVEFSHSSDNLIVPQLHSDNRIGPRKLSSLRELLIFMSMGVITLASYPLEPQLKENFTCILSFQGCQGSSKSRSHHVQVIFLLCLHAPR